MRDGLAQLRQHVLGKRAVCRANAFNVDLLDDTVVDQQREALAAHAHAARDDAFDQRGMLADVAEVCSVSPQAIGLWERDLRTLDVDLTDPELPRALATWFGAAHAGWRGALTGVIEATIAAMEKLGAARQRMVAATGPMIDRKSVV